MQAARLRQISYGIVAVQMICTAFFLFDVTQDFLGTESHEDSSTHLYMELVVAIGLLLGLVLGVVFLRKLMDEQRKAEHQLKVASGAFGEMAQIRFDEWGLTPTEQEVALFTLKGYSLAEIAALRGKSEGTIKAQSNAIYRKSGVSSRTHLISMFIEDLIDDPVASA